MPLARADVRDACFAHWPVDPARLAPLLPDALRPATREGSAWVSVLCQRTLAGLHGFPFRHEYPQLAVRTYVVRDGTTAGGEVGVYFLRVEADSRVASTGARLLYEIPFRYASVFHRRDGNAFEVGTDGPEGRGSFRARFTPRGAPSAPDPGSLDAWLADRYGYYLPDGRRGETAHSPWRVVEADVTVVENDLFDRLGAPEPNGDPVFRYSSGADFRLVRRP